jgi:hypothetical protein
MKHSTRRFFPLLLLIALFAMLWSCATPGPQSAELDRVHENYRREFAGLSMPQSPGEQPAGDFSDTLRAIREFKASHPGASKEAAHFTVLEGMIYLQTGQIGMARALRDDVAQAAIQLRQESGRHPRDELFALAFDPLLRGWADVHGPRRNNIDMLRAGEEISDLLERTGSGSGDKDFDEGALYLAASASAFSAPYLAGLGDTGSEKEESVRIATRNYKLIGRYLTPAEEQDARAGRESPIPGRRRYLRLYRSMWERAGRPA